MTLRIVSDGSIGQVPKAPRVVLPPRDLFADRAARFTQLAGGHALAEYLRVMAHVARAQQQAYAARSAPAVDPTLLDCSHDYGMPPIAALSHARDKSWRDDLHDIVLALRAQAATVHASHPDALAPHWDALAPHLDALLLLLDAATPNKLEALADRILCGQTADEDAAAVPFVGAALQVYFARLAATLSLPAVESCDVASICPVCATRPVASVVRIGGGRESLRYLHCALCATEWNMPRVRCSMCEAEKSVHYLSIDAGEQRAAANAVAKAETCDECHSYLKIFNQEQDPLVDPVADDLATLALDLLVDERGYARSGPNLLFHPGHSEAAHLTS
jgi:FdhE protein